MGWDSLLGGEPAWSQDVAETSRAETWLLMDHTSNLGAEEAQAAEPRIRVGIHFPSTPTSLGELPMPELLALAHCSPGELMGWCCPSSALAVWHTFWLRNELCR